MSWIYVALFSHLLFAIIFALDKVILKRSFSPLRYTMVLGFLSGASALVIPFVDFIVPSLAMVGVAFLTGAAFLAGVYLYFRALERYEVSWVAPLLFGVCTPIFTFAFSYVVLQERLDFFELIAFLVLLAGGFLISSTRRYVVSALGIIALAGLFVGLEFTLLKMLFNATNFWTGYIASRLGVFVAVLLFAVGRILFFGKPFPDHSKLARERTLSTFGTTLLVGAKQVVSIAGSLLLYYSVSLGSPTLVNGLSGVRYALLFVLVLFLAHRWPRLMDEPLSWGIVTKKTIAIIFITLGVLVLLVTPAAMPGAKTWGVTYSAHYVRDMGLDGRAMFTAILDDLRVREFRLVAYWDLIEAERGRYDFSEIDFQLNELAARGGRAVVAVGIRLPRWAECHEPTWVKSQTPNIKSQALMEYIQATVERYKNHPAVWAWQVENEPFLSGFGECTKLNVDLLDREVALVRSLDTKPVILTDSGELGRWYQAYRRADIFGTTMYRVIWNQNIPGGYFEYPLGPDFFTRKAALMHAFFGTKPIVGIELQAEPWTHKRPWETPLAEQFRAFDVAQFQLNVEYAREVGFETNYLWGVEWWYWMKETQYHPEFWEYAKTLF